MRKADKYLKESIEKIINDDFSPLEEYVDEINSVTLEEAKEVAKKYFNKKNLCFVRLN